jgi:sporulation protein YlmC with PRC-barrel domain
LAVPRQFRLTPGQNGNKEADHMKRSILVSSVAACICLGFSAPLLAAEPPVAGTATQPASSEKNVPATKPVEACLSDLRAFDSQMEKDGYWLGGSGYGYGYPMGGDGYGYRFPMRGKAAAIETGYQNARPGYEVRMLIGSANILARHGQQQPCEDVLATARDIYKVYVADMHSGKVPIADVPGWRQQQIASAQPVTSRNTSFRSDALLGTDVRNLQNEALGSVEDLVMSPQTGKIAYLVIGRGGIFGIDEKYVPVPWEDFKITPSVNLVVLDTTKAAWTPLRGLTRTNSQRPATSISRVRRLMPTGRRTSRTKTKAESIGRCSFQAPNARARGARNVVESISDQRLRHSGKRWPAWHYERLFI